MSLRPGIVRPAVLHDGLGAPGLREQDRPWRDVAVPLDKGRRRPRPADGLSIEQPDLAHHLAVVAVDEERLAVAVLTLGAAGEVNLPDMLHGKGVNIAGGVVAMIDGADI